MAVLRLLGLLLLFAMVSPLAARADDTGVLKVMTFNIRYGSAPDKADSWGHRRNLLFDVIKNEHCSLIGLQEALQFQIDELLTEFSRYSSLGVGRDADGGGEYSAILYDKFQFDVSESGTFWLSDTTELPGSMSWGNSLPRICTWAEFFDRKSKQSFHVFNTHWDHVSQPSRERAGMLIRDRIASRIRGDAPVIVTGDFNVGEGNAAWTALLEAGLRDSFRDLHPDATDVGTFHAFKGVEQGAKIDAIFVSPHWQVEAAEIIRSNQAGRYPSDHFPVTATLTLKSGTDILKP